MNKLCLLICRNVHVQKKKNKNINTGFSQLKSLTYISLFDLIVFFSNICRYILRFSVKNSSNLYDV